MSYEHILGKHSPAFVTRSGLRVYTDRWLPEGSHVDLEHDATIVTPGVVEACRDAVAQIDRLLGVPRA